jgi:hypothetical protein
MIIENVRYYRFAVRFTLADGRRRRRFYWSPGFPWVYDEVGRSLLDEFGLEGIKPHSCTITQCDPMPEDVRTPYGAKRTRVVFGLVAETLK